MAHYHRTLQHFYYVASFVFVFKLHNYVIIILQLYTSCRMGGCGISWLLTIRISLPPPLLLVLLSFSLDPDRRRSYTETVGSAYWMAPECFFGKSYCEQADVFSFGITLAEVITRIPADPDYMPRRNVSTCTHTHTHTHQYSRPLVV